MLFKIRTWNVIVEDDTPLITPTPDEQKRAKWREYARIAREKKRAAKLQEQQQTA